MARGQVNKLYRTFSKGLITEAGFLTYPEDASTDELNTVIHRKGNRSRRFGLDYEPSSTALSLPAINANATTTEYLWKAVANKAEINFLCVQVEETIHFFDTSSTPVTAGHKAFTINLNDYLAPTATLAQIKLENVQMSAGKGYLFIVQQYVDPIVVEYDPATNTITTTKVVIQMRDYDGVHDGLANDEEPLTLSNEHHYNLRNQGWIEPGTIGTVPSGGGVPASSTIVYYDPFTGLPHTYVGPVYIP